MKELNTDRKKNEIKKNAKVSRPDHKSKVNFYDFILMASNIMTNEVFVKANISSLPGL